MQLTPSIQSNTIPIIMSRGSAKIVATPSKVEGPKSRELSVELEASLARMREDGFKYIDDFGFKKLGDPIIDYRRDSEQWPDPQDIELIVFCQAEQGQNITYAEIKVDQSSHNHEAHIIGGGIGKDNIRILIRARNTYWLRYEVRMYGEQPLGKILAD